MNSKEKEEDECQWIQTKIQRAKNTRFVDLSNEGLACLPLDICDIEDLVVLNLRNNNLRLLPSKISQLRTLKCLDIGMNLLCAVPSSLGYLCMLTSINLTKNQLSQIPLEIGKLINLVDLFLGENKLTSLPKEIKNLKDLRRLYLNSNLLITLPKELCKLEKSLITLELGGNPFEDAKLKDLVSQNRSPSVLLTYLKFGNENGVPTKELDKKSSDSGMKTKSTNTLPRASISYDSIKISQNNDPPDPMMTELENLRKENRELRKNVVELQSKQKEGERVTKMLLDQLEEVDQQRMCTLCFDSPKSILFLPCRHLVVCAACYSLCANVHTCLICRSFVAEAIHIFVT